MHRAIDGHNDIGTFFGLDAAPQIGLIPIEGAACSITRLQCHVLRPVDGLAVTIPPQDAYFLMLYLKDALHCDILRDAEKTPVSRYEEGSICLVDLREGAAIELHSDLDAIAFVLPFALFAEVSTNYPEGAPFNGLKCVRGRPDGVMRSIGNAIIPFFEKLEGETRPLDHMAIALCAHVAHSYPDPARQDWELRKFH